MKDFWETQQYPKNGKDFTRIEKWLLDDLIRSMEQKPHREMTSSERVLMEALYNVQESYRKTDFYFRKEEIIENKCSDLEETKKKLEQVKEERDSLLYKVREASIASGLFIKSVREKLGWDKEK